MVIPDQQMNHQPPEQTGYHQQLLAVVVGLLMSAPGLVVASAFCTLCIAGSGVLWIRGLWGVVLWAHKVGKYVPSAVKDAGRRVASWRNHRPPRATSLGKSISRSTELTEIVCDVVVDWWENSMENAVQL